MNGIEVSSERFKSMLAEKGITAYALARQIGSTDQQMHRIKCGKYTTSFRFLERLVPVFGLSAVADIIADEQKSEVFTGWYVGRHRPPRRPRTKIPEAVLMPPEAPNSYEADSENF